MTTSQYLLRATLVGALLSILIAGWAQGEPPGAGAPIAIEFHVIGLVVDGATEAQLQQVAAAAGGQYYDARNQEALALAFGAGFGVTDAVGVVEREQEPNGSYAQADPIAPSGSVTGSIDPVRDVDFFRLEVPRAGELTVRIAEVAPELAIAFRVHDADRRINTDWQRPLREGAETTGFADLPRAGEYFLELRQSGDNAASSQPYVLETVFAPVAEAWEPNDSPGMAAPLTLGAPILATTLPAGDVDWYRVEVGHRGEMHLRIDQVPEQLTVVARVWNAERRVLHDWMRPLRAGADNDMTFDLPTAGEYFLEVKENGRERSPQPFRMTASFVPVDDGPEPNDSIGTAYPIVLDDEVRETILPRRDVDWRRFDIPGRSRLELTVTEVAPELDIVMRVWDDDNRVFRDWIRPLRAGADTEGVIDFARAGRYYLELRDGGDDARSTQAYALTTRLTTVVDLHDQNDAIGRADPIRLGSSVQGTVLPARDHDWYRVGVDRATRLQVHLSGGPPEMTLAFRVWSADNRVVLDWQRGLAPGAEVAGEANVPEPGYFFIEVAAAGDRDSSTVPYTLVARIE
jgi:hypothetical protein